jgi:ribulose-5-phosphate 4-epimerase/fuculose-1-phosphate aldolase
MERLIDRYEKKLIDQGLVLLGESILAEIETEPVFTRQDPACDVMREIFKEKNISSLLFSPPAEPYRTIVDYLAKYTEVITLKDNETRTFLHDLPVVEEFSSKPIIAQLNRRKGIIIRGQGIMTYGTVSPEQPYIVFSSILFACFVKFFSDFLQCSKKKNIPPEFGKAFEKVMEHLPPSPDIHLELKRGLFKTEEEVYSGICEVGKKVMQYGLVDSVMGNISYLLNGTLYISQTGTFLDELEGYIDACPMDQSSCVAITASTELPTHMQIARNSTNLAILHGHPKFAIIMSMICKKEECEFKNFCHIKCPENRSIRDIPIVPGESGSGPLSLSQTVPKALEHHRAVIVYGHGVFTTGDKDFNLPFNQLMEIEIKCRGEYFKQLEENLSNKNWVITNKELK